jgi:tetratricopeptide (TPR) repeat protein
MSSKIPIVKQMAWLSAIPHLIIFACLVLVVRLLGFKSDVPIGAILFLAIYYILRYQVPKHHRRGIVLYKKKKFTEAIPHFQKSYDFFRNKSWIDKYRYIALLSSSRISYTEMALINMAYCHGQIGNGKESKMLYKKTLEEFPNSEMAKASLRMFESAEKITEPLYGRGSQEKILPP